MATPPKQTARDFDPDVLALFDDYVHGAIDRRGFLTRAGRIAGAAGAVGLLAALSPQFASAQQIAPDDARLQTRHVEFDSPKGNGRGRGYLAQPAGTSGPLPMVLVVHENRGLNPHIEDVARRIALEGYIAFAPDALFPKGGYPGEEDAARALFATLDQDTARQDFVAAAGWLQKTEGGNGRLGVVGFCYGGGMANWLATQLPTLRAAVPFYGPAAPLEDVPKITAELLVVLASNDARVNAQWPDYEAALKAAGKTFALYQPADTEHGFNNDTTPRYDEAAAREAWTKMLALFARTLKVPA
ncbi:dienelactone hydrolase family protein [Luteimonas fraxinea]|uniref:Dienelactone hydrolase family protein n=1 Tax=Luteimonas fraxinea TaxID=2901869 RepID=A0ABS8UCA9_9GAMM|nr:dienelactone hydrolase family protein [Luteimonas fraxinea]MCD9096364.1 dienelactone hydrolase family protein [Luteimonas fraxinea]MCD9125707.1 dienelactone hydrolase family protein [Luteimonas fraxinea]UHH10262.1 dienelactone hydrolase family protein [Luteimonas fraxinea]